MSVPAMSVPPLFHIDVQEAVARVRERNPVLKAFVTTRLDEVVDEARRATGPLAGVPYGLKDAWDTAGIRTTGGSWRFRDRVPAASALVHRVLSDAGAVLVGKTNLSDLSVAPEASSHVGGTTHNPHDLERTSGGSSGGAAAAVADGMINFDWGSDIGGSIRLPAAFCGVYGMRLSSATWPVHGYFPSPPDSMLWMNGGGPITSSLAQMRMLLELTAPRMRTGAVRPFEARAAMLYAPRHGHWPSFEDDVTPMLEAALGRHGDRGEVRRDHGLPLPHVVSRIASAVWASHFDALLDLDPMTFREGLSALVGAIVFGGRSDKRLHPRTAEVLALITLGRYTLFRDRGRALEGAHAFQNAVTALWDQGYLWVAPVCAYPAPRIGTTTRHIHLLDNTFPGNLADATGLAIPWGRFDDGLPRALQLLGPPGSELTLIEVAGRLEAARATCDA